MSDADVHTPAERRAIQKLRKAVRERCDVYSSTFNEWEREFRIARIPADALEHSDRGFLAAARLQIYNAALATLDQMILTRRGLLMDYAMATMVESVNESMTAVPRSSSPTGNLMRAYRLQARAELAEFVASNVVPPQPLQIEGTPDATST